MENNNLNWEMVPEGWALCFNQNCPLHEACLRYQAGLLELGNGARRMGTLF